MYKKSSFCASGGCVEVGWQQSSQCTSSTNCVQVHQVVDEVHVRDSKDSDGPILAFNFKEWTAFVKGVKNGEFDL